MTSIGINVSNSNDYWKGTDYIERKLGSVLDRKLASSTKQVLLDRIQFKEASKPDPFYTDLKNKYVPLNNSSNEQYNGGKNAVNAQGNKGFEGKPKLKDELPAPKYILFEREKIHLKWKNIRRVGPGLFNLGNTCFLNSVIQVLTYTPPLANYLATQEHSRTCHSVGFCMLCELQRHVVRTFGHNQNEAIKPMVILQKLKYIAKHLRFGHQEDSHEFLRYVIDGMLKSCLAGVSEKLDCYTKGTTMVHQVFGGYYRSQVTCERCHHTSSTYDPLMEILLDIKHAHSVTKSLQRLINVELLSGDNMYLCPRCKRKVPAKKHLTVHKAPNVMTMCLKRFECHSLFGSKLNKEVNYPEHLNLRPFMSKKQGPEVNYKLYAVLVHSGYSCNSGHYYCFIKASNCSWYHMNDSTVRQVGLKTVLSQQAYLLFYIRDQKIPKEKPYPVQVKVPSVNGVKTYKPEGFNGKQINTKIINEPKKGELRKVDSIIGQSVPRKPDPFVRVNNPNNNNNNKLLPLTREKVSFPLNIGAMQKKTISSATQNKKLNTGKSDEQQNRNLETPSLTASKSEQERNPQSSENIAQTGDSDRSTTQDVGLRLTENIAQDKTSSAENKLSNGHGNSTKQDEAACTTETVHGKESNEASQNNLHATTKWKVTTNDASPSFCLPPGVTPGTKRERTPSLSSDVSNACSIASKTGDWAVTDRSTPQDIGPRLPERQHAGWKVCAGEDAASTKKEEEERWVCADEDAASTKKEEEVRWVCAGEDAASTKKEEEEERLVCAGEDAASTKKEEEERWVCAGEDAASTKKEEEERWVCAGEDAASTKKEEEEEREKTPEKINEDEVQQQNAKLKRKHSKEKPAKTKIQKTEDKTKLLSEEPRERSEEESEKEEKSCKNAKKEKKEKKENKKKSLSSGHDSDSNSETEKRKKEHKKSKKRKKKKRRHRSPSETNGCGSQDGEFQSSSKSENKNHDSSSSEKITEKAKELVNKVVEVVKRKDVAEDRRPLVQYSDHSSSSEESAGNTRSNKGLSRSDPEDNKDNRNNTTASLEDISCARSRNGNESKKVVDALLGHSRDTSNYGCEVARWDGERVDVRVKREGDNNRRRRDEWDDEYDQGKTKRTKQKERFLSRSYGDNPFQREHDRKRMRNDGWRYSTSSSSSSSRWHNRSIDRYSRRDRK